MSKDIGQLLCGRKTVFDALRNNVSISVIYTTKPQELKNINDNIIVKEVSNQFLSSLVQVNHQGFVAEIFNYNYYDSSVIFKDKPKTVLILDHIQDPRNFGAILRSTNAFGIKHIVIPKERAAKITPTVLKTSAGGFVGIKIIRVSSLMSLIQKMKKSDFWIYATSFSEKSEEISRVNFNYPLALIIGNEQKGVSKSLIKHCDQEVMIKTIGTVQSLNVSVATGVILFELQKK